MGGESELLASDEAVPLVAHHVDGAGESFRRRDRRRVPVLSEELVYSTATHLVVEQRLVDAVVNARPTRRERDWGIER